MRHKIGKVEHLLRTSDILCLKEVKVSARHLLRLFHGFAASHFIHADLAADASGVVITFAKKRTFAKDTKIVTTGLMLRDILRDKSPAASSLARGGAIGSLFTDEADQGIYNFNVHKFDSP